MKRQEQFHCRFLDYRLLGSCLLSCLLICLARTTLHASESNFNALNDTIAADVALPDSLLTDDNVYRYTFSNFPLACRPLAIISPISCIYTSVLPLPVMPWIK